MGDFPGSPVDKNSPANAGDTGSILVWEDSTCCKATKPGCSRAHKPQLLSPHTAVAEARAPRAWALRQQKSPQREAHSEEEPRLPQLEKARTQQGRSRVAKNKQI